MFPKGENMDVFLTSIIILKGTRHYSVLLKKKKNYIIYSHAFLTVTMKSKVMQVMYFSYSTLPSRKLWGM